MGCDIHIFAEKKNESGSYEVVDAKPFDDRHYGAFGFLAGVRNYSDITPICQPRGFPDDAASETKEQYEVWSGDAHTPSWLLVAELASFNYDAPMEDRRVTRQTGPNSWDGGCTCNPGEGEQTTYREFLGSHFMRDLENLKGAGADRVVFWFDN